MKNSALITGVYGQDGSYLVDFLRNMNYEVFGQSKSYKNSMNLDLKKEYIGDIVDSNFVQQMIKDCNPSEIYNLASLSTPSLSWNNIPDTLSVNGIGAVNIFEAVRKISPSIKILHASSSEMFGKLISPANEDTKFSPQNPYAVSKCYAHNMANLYRERYGLNISCAILFNHESERRPLNFITQKIAYGAACASLGIKSSFSLNEIDMPIVDNGYLTLGNLNISRDWGYAPDFIEAMWLCLMQIKLQDFVIGTGKLNSIKDLCNFAYGSLGLDWKNHVKSSTVFERPFDNDIIVANPNKARIILGWEPTVEFKEMVKLMVDHQIYKIKNLERY